MNKATSWTIYAVTVEGESDCEGLFVAPDSDDALRQFRESTGTGDGEWEAHVAFPPDVLDGLDKDEMEVWLQGYSFACERFAG